MWDKASKIATAIQIGQFVGPLMIGLIGAGLAWMRGLPPFVIFLVSLGALSISVWLVNGAFWGLKLLRGRMQSKTHAAFAISLEKGIGHHFRNERVPIDNRLYMDCTFENVTFVWDGGEGSMDNVHFQGTKRLEILNPERAVTVDVLKLLGFLTPEFAESWTHTPTERPRT